MTKIIYLLDEIKEKLAPTANEGMDALIAKLGYVDTERFIMLVSREPLDYTEWGQEYLENDISIRELSSMVTRIL